MTDSESTRCNRLMNRLRVERGFTFAPEKMQQGWGWKYETPGGRRGVILADNILEALVKLAADAGLPTG